MNMKSKDNVENNNNNTSVCETLVGDGIIVSVFAQTVSAHR